MRGTAYPHLGTLESEAQVSPLRKIAIFKTRSGLGLNRVILHSTRGPVNKMVQASYSLFKASANFPRFGRNVLGALRGLAVGKWGNQVLRMPTRTRFPYCPGLHSPVF